MLYHEMSLEYLIITKIMIYLILGLLGYMFVAVTLYTFWTQDFIKRHNYIPTGHEEGLIWFGSTFWPIGLIVYFGNRLGYWLSGKKY